MALNINKVELELKFDWCRHGESAANLAQGSMPDKFQNYELDKEGNPPHFEYIKADIDEILGNKTDNQIYVEKNHTQAINQISSITSGLKSPYLYHPNLSF